MPFSLIVETVTHTFEATENPDILALGEVRIRSSKLMVIEDVTPVSSGDCGLNDHQILNTEKNRYRTSVLGNYLVSIRQGHGTISVSEAYVSDSRRHSSTFSSDFRDKWREIVRGAAFQTTTSLNARKLDFSLHISRTDVAIPRILI